MAKYVADSPFQDTAAVPCSSGSSDHKRPVELDGPGRLKTGGPGFVIFVGIDSEPNDLADDMVGKD